MWTLKNTGPLFLTFILKGTADKYILLPMGFVSLENFDATIEQLRVYRIVPKSRPVKKWRKKKRSIWYS